MTIVKHNVAWLLAVTLFSCGVALADKPAGTPGKSGKHNSANQKHESETYFNDDTRSRIRHYYSQRKPSGRCPPGLAKKHNHCQPPGLAKQWHRGERLPDHVRYYDLPHALLHELGRTREGQKLIRVGTDILLIDMGSRVVLDAFDDLGDAF